MLKLISFLVLVATVQSNDVTVGKDGGRKIFDENREAAPALWKQAQNVTIETADSEIISRIIVTDLRPEKDGEANIVEGGEGQKNVTIELKSPAVFRGFQFQIEVFAVPDRSNITGESDINELPTTEMGTPTSAKQEESTVMMETSSTTENAQESDLTTVSTVTSEKPKDNAWNHFSDSILKTLGDTAKAITAPTTEKSIETENLPPTVVGDQNRNARETANEGDMETATEHVRHMTQPEPFANEGQTRDASETANEGDMETATEHLTQMTPPEPFNANEGQTRDARETANRDMETENSEEENHTTEVTEVTTETETSLSIVGGYQYRNSRGTDNQEEQEETVTEGSGEATTMTIVHTEENCNEEHNRNNRDTGDKETENSEEEDDTTMKPSMPPFTTAKANDTKDQNKDTRGTASDNHSSVPTFTTEKANETVDRDTRGTENQGAIDPIVQYVTEAQTTENYEINETDTTEITEQANSNTSMTETSDANLNEGIKMTPESMPTTAQQMS